MLLPYPEAPTVAAGHLLARVIVRQSLGMSAQHRIPAEERTFRIGSFVLILLRKSLMVSGNSDSVAVMRFAVEASDDGAAQSRPRAVALFISS